MAEITADRSASSRTSLEGLARDFWWNGFVVLKGLIPPTLVDDVRSEIDELYEDDDNRRARRVQDAWEIQRATREIATAQPLLETLRFFFGRRPIPYQTLSFLHGSQQRSHSDCWHVSSMPAGFVCSAWAAIDPAGSDNGPLYCYPGSHHLDELTPQHLAPSLDDVDPLMYEKHQESLMQRLGYERHVFHAQPGDVIVFAGNLVHGGYPITDPGVTRRSVVTQYVFDECVYYSPRHSDLRAGEVALRDSLVDIRDEHRAKHSYDGKPVAYFRLRSGRSRVYLDATIPQRVTAWLHEASSRFPQAKDRIRRGRERKHRQATGTTVRLR